jgi:hypothetical protein
MFTFVRLSRCVGMLCLVWLSVLASLSAAFAEATEPAVCDAAWHAAADKRAAEGLEMVQDTAARQRVRLWRLITLGEDEPQGDPGYSYPRLAILPAAFADDPEVARIQALIGGDQLAEAVTAIEALTRIPDPASTDIATERLLVRSELLFAGVLWAGYWDGTEPVFGPALTAQKWMALLDAHFLSLPLAVLEGDGVVNGAYWRAIDDLDWFLRSDASRDRYRGRQPEDWWLDDAAAMNELGGVRQAARESDLLDWLQTMEQARGLGGGAWLSYLSDRAEREDYRKTAGHAVDRAEGKSLPWVIAADLWWAPDLPEDEGQLDAVRAIYEAHGDIRQRVEYCRLSVGEQYAQGPLRYHALRRELLEQQAPRYGWLSWSNRYDVENVAGRGGDPETLRELARFVIAAGNPAAVPKSGPELPTTLRALIAPDLDAFAAADPDPAAINVLPLRVLAELAAKPALAPPLRAAVARLAWTRAYLLDDQAMLERLTPLLIESNPRLQPYLDAYDAAWTDAGRRHAALILLLKVPAMQPVLADPGDLSEVVGAHTTRAEVSTYDSWKDVLTEHDDLNHNDNNWWCQVDPSRLVSKLRDNFYNSPLGIDGGFSGPLQEQLDRYRDQILKQHAVVGQIDWEELGRLAKIPRAPVYLSGEAIAWAEGSWWDRTFDSDRIAEALALSLRAARWGCNRDGPNGKASNAAYRALHRLFPESAAAKHTPYWYN